MSLILKCLFLVLACIASPLNSSLYESQEEEEVGVTDRFLMDEMSVKMDQNDENDYDTSFAQIDDGKPLESRLEPKSGSPGPAGDRDNKVPMINHLTMDQINEMHEEKNANFDFSQNFYVNLNSTCNLQSIIRLVAFLILTLM